MVVEILENWAGLGVIGFWCCVCLDPCTPAINIYHGGYLYIAERKEPYEEIWIYNNCALYKSGFNYDDLRGNYYDNSKLYVSSEKTKIVRVQPWDVVPAGYLAIGDHPGYDDGIEINKIDYPIIITTTIRNPITGETTDSIESSTRTMLVVTGDAVSYFSPYIVCPTGNDPWVIDADYHSATTYSPD